MKKFKYFFSIILFLFILFGWIVNCEAATLENGTSLQGKLKDFIGTNTNSEIIFGKYDTYKSEVKDLSDLYKKNVDINNSGSIILYKKYLKLYILSNDTIVFNVDCSGMFRELKVKSITFSNIDTSNVTNMSNMFRELTFNEDDVNLNLSSFNTKNVSNMSNMFYYANMGSITFGSNFLTDNVEDFSYMFQNSKVGNLNLSLWKSTKAKTTKSMFASSNITSITFGSGFTMENVTDATGMFSSCKSLISADLSYVKFTNLEKAESMFYLDEKLETLKFGNDFKTDNLTTVYYMFGGCSSLKELNLSSFSTKKLINTKYMFSGCSKLEKVYVSYLWVNTNISNSFDMFYNCSSLKGYGEENYVFGFDSSNVDKKYARINYNATKQGYFTYKSNTNEGTWDQNDYGKFYSINVTYDSNHLAITSNLLSSYEAGSNATLEYTLRPGYILYKVLINNKKVDDINSIDKIINIDNIQKNTTVELKTIAEDTVIEGDANLDYEFSSLDFDAMRSILVSYDSPSSDVLARIDTNDNKMFELKEFQYFIKKLAGAAE